MALSGNWRAARGRRDRVKDWGATQPDAHVHAWDDDAEIGGARPPAVPSTLDTSSRYVERADWEHGTATTPGLSDGEPSDAGTDDHTGTDWGIGYDERAGGEVSHGRDLGTVDWRLRRPTMSIDGLALDTDLRQLDPDRVTAGSLSAVGRGLNGLPMNNPDPAVQPRVGRRTYRVVDRKMYRPRIEYAERIVPVRNAPGGLRGSATGTGRYSSPYDYGVSARRRKMSVPLVRRTPAPVDTLTDAPDASADLSANFGTWSL